eukprot:Skav210928  [mRNA]  locus=scaffold978:365318:370450:+ [translate_table: standard]
MYLDHHAGLPAPHRDGFNICAPDLPERHRSSEDESEVTSTWTQVSKRISFATANVNSLSQKGDGHGGKIDLIREQMRAFHINVLGLQETRSSQSMSCKHNILRLSSGATHGQGGLELWVDLQAPYGNVNEGLLRFEQKHFVVTKADAHLMIVQVHAPHFRGTFVVGHAPHSGHPREQCHQWWTDLEVALQDTSADVWLVLMLDANARSGASDGLRVLQHDDEDSPNTPYLRDFMEKRDLVMPSSAAVHEGRHSTWQTPDGLHEQRIDYVLVSRSLEHLCTHSEVLDTFDLATTQGDHFAVGLQLHADEWRQQTGKPLHRRVEIPFDRGNIQNLPISAAVNLQEVPSWTTDIETHINSFNHLVHAALRPPPKNRLCSPKKTWIDPATWEIRNQKVYLRRRLRQGRLRLRTEDFHACFLTWKQASQHGAAHQALAIRIQESQVYRRSLRCQLLHLYALFRRTARNLKHALCRLRATALDAALQPAEGHRTLGSASEIIKILKPFIGPTNPQKIKKQQLPHVLDADGHPCATPDALVNRWAEFFGSMEGGTRMSHAAYREVWHDHLAARRGPDNQNLDLLTFPTLTELEAALRRVATGKATGCDSIPSEACKFHATAFARHLYAPLLKLLTHGQEAWQHKGGVLVQAYKQKGPANACASYRSLLISSHIGKSLHRTLRERQYPNFERHLHPCQLGGRKAMPVGVGLHHMRAFQRAFSAQKRSIALIFLDLQEAFYRVWRPLCMRCEYKEDIITALAHRLHLADGTLQALRARLCGPNAFHRSELDEHYERALSAMHDDTWFVIRGQRDCVKTEAGSRPGDSMADVVFSFVFADVLREVHRQMDSYDLLEIFPGHAEDAGGLHAAPTEEAASFLGAAWMDDLSIGLTGRSASELEHKTGHTLSILLDTCRSFGMTPNLTKGKTEALMAFQGSGSRQLRKRYFGPSQAGQMTVICEDGPYQIHVVGHYKHLGGVLHHAGSLKPEIRQRTAQAHAAFDQHRKLIYRNPRIDAAARRELLQSLVLSKLCYGCESWTFSTLLDKNHFHSSVMRLYRRFGGFAHDAHVTDDDILLQTGLLEPSLLLRRARLRYLGTLYRVGARAQWALLQADSAWHALLCEDLAWMHAQLENSSDLPDPASQFGTWENLIKDHYTYWKKLVNRAVEHARLQHVNRIGVEQMHRRVLVILTSHGTLHDMPSIVQPCEATSHFGCFACRKRFKSRAGEGAHFFRSHGWTDPVRLLYDGTHCPACLKEFHTHYRVQCHLRHAHDCRAQLLQRGVHDRPAPGAGSRANVQLAQHHDGLLPVLQASGPQPLLHRGHHPDVYDANLYHALLETLLEWDGELDLELALRALFHGRTISWTLSMRTLDYILEQMQLDEDEHIPVTIAELAALFGRLRDPATWDFMQAGLDQDLSMHTWDLHSLEQWFVQFCHQETPPWSRDEQIPRDFGNVRIVLHVFAGRRRRGDFQWFLDAMAEQFDYPLWVVSLDIVISAEHGDLLNAGVRRYWYQAIFDRWVCGLLCGPPCETWSIARGNVLTTASGRQTMGPRPIRASDAPWGKSSLRLREIKQIVASNQLMEFGLVGVAAVGLNGGLGVLEHPLEPEDDDKPSIWKQPLMNALLRLPGFRTVRLAQGLLGAWSPKPTQLLAANLPTQGGFMTTGLKEYPPAFCAALGKAFAVQLAKLSVTEARQPPPEFLAVCKAMHCTDFGEHIGQDFAG